MRRASASFAALSLLLAASVALAPLIEARDVSAHAHRWCETHATLEEAELAGPELVSSGAQDSSEGPSVFSLDVAMEFEADAHAGCVLATLAHRSLSATAARHSIILQSGDLHGPELAVLPWVPAPVARLRLAPKASPPSLRA